LDEVFDEPCGSVVAISSVDFDFYDIREVDVVASCNTILLVKLSKAVSDVLALHTFGDPESDPGDDSTYNCEFDQAAHLACHLLV
jgi:hypothetical protein